MEIKPQQTTWNKIEFYLILFLYMFECLFQIVSKYIVGPLKYSEEDLTGKIVIVTGANSGLGKATAYELARRGATVVMAGRDASKLEEAANDIRSRTTAGKLVKALAKVVILIYINTKYEFCAFFF